MQKITPFLWLNDQAEEAARFYVSLFAGSRIVSVTRKEAGETGKAFLVTFELEGRPYMALNGGPHFALNEAFSMHVECETQAEIDRLWDALLADGGAPSQCGWLRDRFGLTWQLVPRVLPELISQRDPARSQRVMAAMFEMVKLDIAALERAAAGG